MDDSSDEQAPAPVEHDLLVGSDRPDRGRGRGTKVAVAVGIVLLIAALAVPLALRGSEPTPDELPTLGISPAGTTAERAMTAGDAAMSMPAMDVRYQVGGELPDLGDSGPVWQTVDPGVDAAWVDSAAAVLHVPGEVTRLDEIAPAFGWQVDAGGLLVMGGSLPMLHHWVDDDVVASSSSGCAGSGVAVETVPEGDETAEGAPAAAAPDDPPADDCGAVVVEDPAPPCCAPSDAEAETIALALLGDLEVPGEWDATAQAAAARFEAVACAPGADCTDAAPSDEQVLTRSVSLTRMLDGQAVAGLEWYVEIGAAGVVLSASGPVVELEELGDYPLRPVDEAVQALVDGDPSAIQAPTSMPGGWASYAATSGGPVALGAPDAVSSSEVLRSEVPAVGCGPEPCSSPGSAGSSAAGGGVDGCTPEQCGEATVATVAPDVVGTGPVGPTSTVVCVTDPCPGDDVVLPEPMPMPTEPGPVPEPGVQPGPEGQPEPVVVTITGATLARAVMFGTAPDGSPTVYVVPTYDLAATTGDGTPWPVALVAISPDLVATPEVSRPEPVPGPETSVPQTTVVDGATETPPSKPTTRTSWVDPHPGPTVVDPDPDVTTVPVTTVPVTTVP